MTPPTKKAKCRCPKEPQEQPPRQEQEQDNGIPNPLDVDIDFVRRMYEQGIDNGSMGQDVERAMSLFEQAQQIAHHRLSVLQHIAKEELGQQEEPDSQENNTKKKRPSQQVQLERRLESLIERYNWQDLVTNILYRCVLPRR